MHTHARRRVLQLEVIELVLYLVARAKMVKKPIVVAALGEH